MKKLLLIPALLLGTLSMAADYDYEITPVIGYNIAEGNINLDNYAVFGAEFQYNGFDFPIKPELSLLSSKADYENTTLDTKVHRIALNGVYEFDKLGFITPLAKAGVGYEKMSDTYASRNRNSAFVDAGVGAKIPFNDFIALKLEAVYMLKYNNDRYDNNLAFLAGLNFAFGAQAQKAAPVAEKVVEEPVKEEPVAEAVVAAVAVVDGDDDNDGVLNSVDKCPTTEAGKTVNAEGCFIDGDDDNDGVLNSKDICPNTPAGDAVNSDGCSATVNLQINFENDSYNVDSQSDARIQEYADFLSTYTNYSAKIVGYTDSKGSAKYNQKLSENRANAVKNLLIEKGAPASSLTSAGMGEASPIADNSTSEGKAQNRRIEAELTKN